MYYTILRQCLLEVNNIQGRRYIKCKHQMSTIKIVLQLTTHFSCWKQANIHSVDTKEKAVTSRESELAEFSSEFFSATLEAFGGSRLVWIWVLLSLALNPLVWFSLKSCEVVSRANLVTRENFSKTWIERSRAGSWTLCLGLPWNWGTLTLPLLTPLSFLSWFSFKVDSDIFEGPHARGTALGSSKEDKVLWKSTKH